MSDTAVVAAIEIAGEDARQRRASGRTPGRVPSARNGSAGARNRGPGEPPPYGQEVAAVEQDEERRHGGGDRRLGAVAPPEQHQSRGRREHHDRRVEEQAVIADEDLAHGVCVREPDAEEARLLLAAVVVGDVAVGEVERRAERRPVVGAEHEQPRHARRRRSARSSAEPAQEDVQHRPAIGDQRRPGTRPGSPCRPTRPGEHGRCAATRGRTRRTRTRRPSRARTRSRASGPISVPSAKVTSAGPPQPGAMPLRDPADRATRAGRTRCRSSGCARPRRRGSSRVVPARSRAGHRSRTAAARQAADREHREAGRLVRVDPAAVRGRGRGSPGRRVKRSAALRRSPARGRSGRRPAATRAPRAAAPRQRRGRAARARSADAATEGPSARTHAGVSRGHEAVVSASGQARMNRP